MFVCLGFGHFILFVYFFLGREAQKVREEIVFCRKV